MKVKVTHGHGWYSNEVGNVFEIGSIEAVEGVDDMCFHLMGDNPYFIRGKHCVLKEDLLNNVPVNVGDVIYIDTCRECPDVNQKFGEVIPSNDLIGFMVNIPSEVYGEYTYISPHSDAWRVVQRDGVLQNEFKETSQNLTDSINHPTHYNSGKFETIEVIKEIVSNYEDSFLAYNIGNVQKYIARAPFKHKTPLDDLKKAAKYLEFAINHLEKDSQ